MFKAKLRGALAALTLIALASPLAAQVQNPGVQQSGAVTSGHGVKWGPGIGQIQDGGVFPAGTVASVALSSPGATVTVGGTSPCTGPTCAFTIDLPNKITGSSVGDASHSVTLTFDNQGRATAIAQQLISIPFTAVTGSLACAQLPALTGDTTSAAGSCATVNVKLNGVAFATSPATDTVPVITSSLTATYTALPNCTSGSLNYTTATHLFSCAAAGSGSVTSVASSGCVTGGPITISGTLTFNPNCQAGYLSGLTLSTAGASATFATGAGVANDSTNVSVMALGAISKTTSAWAVGSAAGALDTGTIANNTWYHVFEMQRPDTGVVDECISVTVTACTTGGNIPAAYTLFRRVGSIKTNGSAQWIKFLQDGKTFTWDAMTQDVAATNPGTAAVTRTLNVPLGVRVQAFVSLGWGVTTVTDGPAAILLSDLAVTDAAPVAATGNATVTGFIAGVVGVTGFNGGSQAFVFTNTSQQIRSRVQVSGATLTLTINTIGWVDTRGFQ